MTLAATLLVLSIAQRADDPAVLAFERAAARVLGDGGRVEIVPVAEDPPDAESEARARKVDGLVELSWSEDGRSARLHCYVVSEGRWIEREISFGSRADETARGAEERGRLLGFAAASTFAESPSAPPRPSPAAPPPSPPPPPDSAPPAPTGTEVGASPERRQPRVLEFAGAVSSGLGGTAGGVGATAAFRWPLAGSLWARVAFLGRTGTIPVAQATTRSLQVGAGAALPLLERPGIPWIVGARLDFWASHFEASHLSEDDVAPDRRSRWLPGCDVMLEGGFLFTGSTGVFASAGAEALFGKTEVYTHGNRVAVVPPLRAVAELGFRAGF